MASTRWNPSMQPLYDYQSGQYIQLQKDRFGADESLAESPGFFPNELNSSTSSTIMNPSPLTPIHQVGTEWIDDPGDESVVNQYNPRIGAMSSFTSNYHTNTSYINSSHTPDIMGGYRQHLLAHSNSAHYPTIDSEQTILSNQQFQNTNLSSSAYEYHDVDIENEAFTALNHITNIVAAANQSYPELLSSPSPEQPNELMLARQYLLHWVRRYNHILASHPVLPSTQTGQLNSTGIGNVIQGLQSFNNLQADSRTNSESHTRDLGSAEYNSDGSVEYPLSPPLTGHLRSSGGSNKRPLDSVQHSYFEPPFKKPRLQQSLDSHLNFQTKSPKQMNPPSDPYLQRSPAAMQKQSPIGPTHLNSPNQMLRNAAGYTPSSTMSPTQAYVMGSDMAGKIQQLRPPGPIPTFEPTSQSPRIITKHFDRNGKPQPPVSMFKVNPSKSAPHQVVPDQSSSNSTKMPHGLTGILTPGMMHSFDIPKPKRQKKKRSVIAHVAPEGAFSLQDFEIRAALGTGTFGKVHLCYHTSSKQYYCIKVLNKQTVYRFKQMDHVENEKQILSKIRHPGIVKLFATFNTADSLHLLMEYVPGGELFFYIRKYGKLPEEIVKFYTAELILILEHLHMRSIVYRDLKPENILLDATGHLKLTDFGFAKFVLDKTFTMCGTPDYLAPEIITGHGHGTAVDWWSLGVLVFEMLAGFPPFTDKDMRVLFRKIQEPEKVIIPASFSQEVTDFIRKLLVTDPSRRLGTMHPDICDIKAHPWFRSIQWNQLEKRSIPAPLSPNLKSAGDTTHFQDQEPHEQPNMSPPVPIPPEVQKYFDQF